MSIKKIHKLRTSFLKFTFSPFFFMVIVNCINNVFFAIFNNFPHCTTNHVTSGIRGNSQTMAFSYKNAWIGLLFLEDIHCSHVHIP